MNFLKKLLKTVVGLGALILVFYWMFGKSSSFLDGTSPLVTGAQYFKNIDAWNVIFIIIFLGPTLALFLIFYFTVDKIYKWIGAKFPKLDFINSEWADIVLQVPGAIALLAVTFIVGSNIYVQVAGDRYKIDSVEWVDAKPVVLLGTSKMLSSGKGENRYYTYRIDAGVDLYQKGKVLFFILSGDGLGEAHKKGTYNETRDMMNDLIERGVPADKIKIDSLGLRTVDSSLRLISVFGVNDVIYISQGFHTSRAVVQSSAYGIKSLAYDAKGSATLKMWLKEIFASRPGLVVDVFFAKTQPRDSGTESGVVETHEKFSVTSNREVALLLFLCAIPVIGLIGVGAFRASSSVERKRVVIKYSLGICLFFVGSSVLAGTVYKTLDFKIKLLDQVVETVAASVGVETTKMEVKKATFEKQKQEYQVKQEASIVQVDLPAAQEIKTEVKKEEAKLDFNTSTETAPVKAKVEEAPVKKEDDMFNTSSSDESSDKKSDDRVTTAEKKFFKVKVHRSEELVNEATIQLRLEEDVMINKKKYSRNHIFEATINLFKGRFVIVSDALGIEVKNYQGLKEGNTIEARHQGKTKEDPLSIAEGEQLVMGF
jgi:SanA protein